MTLRRIVSLAINEEENKKLAEVTQKGVKIIDIFRRGLNETYREIIDTKNA